MRGAGADLTFTIQYPVRAVDVPVIDKQRVLAAHAAHFAPVVAVCQACEPVGTLDCFFNHFFRNKLFHDLCSLFYQRSACTGSKVTSHRPQPRYPNNGFVLSAPVLFHSPAIEKSSASMCAEKSFYFSNLIRYTPCWSGTFRLVLILSDENM